MFLTDERCLVCIPLPIKLTYLTTGNMSFIHKWRFLLISETSFALVGRGSGGPVDNPPSLRGRILGPPTSPSFTS